MPLGNIIANTITYLSVERVKTKIYYNLQNYGKNKFSGVIIRHTSIKMKLCCNQSLILELQAILHLYFGLLCIILIAICEFSLTLLSLKQLLIILLYIQTVFLGVFSVVDTNLC